MSKPASNRKIHVEAASHKETVSAAKKPAAKKTRRENRRQVGVHRSESLHRNAKISLLLQGGKQDFSGLVQQLLVAIFQSINFSIQTRKCFGVIQIGCLVSVTKWFSH